jgi:Pentapeptide repeats (8 copies)
LQDAQLHDAGLNYAQLQGANLSGAHLQSADMREAQLQGADLFKAQMQGADLSGAQLQRAQLSEAQLRGANLSEAQLQSADLSGAELQGADLYYAQLQGADLSEAQLQGADLSEAGLWDVSTNEHTQIGLADLRRVNFDKISTEDVLTAQPDARPPNDATQRARKSLVAGGKKLARADTDAGRILVTDLDDAGWQDFDRGQLTTQPADIDPALAELLADTVAPIAPKAAESIATRILHPAEGEEQRLLIKLLGCRLQDQANARRVTLRVETIEALRRATGPCDHSRDK